TGINKCQRLLATATKDKGIPPLEAQHAQSPAGKLHKTRGYIALLRARFAAALAGIFKLCAGLCELEDGFVHQRVIDDDICLLERIEGMEREKARISRPRPDKPDPTGLK